MESIEAKYAIFKSMKTLGGGGNAHFLKPVYNVHTRKYLRSQKVRQTVYTHSLGAASSSLPTEDSDASCQSGR